MHTQVKFFALVFLCLGLLCCGASAANNSSSSPAASPAPVNEPLPIPYPTDVLTYHYNIFRQGETMQETTLNLSNVNSTSFGKIAFLAADAHVDAQPLYVNKQFINGSLNNTLYM